MTPLDLLAIILGAGSATLAFLSLIIRVILTLYATRHGVYHPREEIYTGIEESDVDEPTFSDDD